MTAAVRFVVALLALLAPPRKKNAGIAGIGAGRAIMRPNPGGDAPPKPQKEREEMKGDRAHSVRFQEKKCPPKPT